MPINITMPALSPTMEEGNLSKWLVKEGDKIAPGDVIAEIETDKATMEVEAVDEGTIAKLVVPAGSEGVKVNALIAILAEEGEDVAAAAKGAASAPNTEAKVEAPKEEPKPAAAPAAVPAPAKAEQPAAANKGDRVFASPLARRIAKESGVDIAAVKGTGPHGRVVQRDVEAALASGGARLLRRRRKLPLLPHRSRCRMKPFSSSLRKALTRLFLTMVCAKPLPAVWWNRSRLFRISI